MRWSVTGLHKIAVGLVLCVVTRTALAEVVTLQCGEVGGPSSLTIDVDYDRGIILIANGNPPRQANAAIDNRFISFNNPYTGHYTRIDRISGGVISYVNGNSYPSVTCKKAGVGGKPIF